MSDYLTRLATRARTSREMLPLRPFVRSTSPIAEHDQRVGMTDFEGFDLPETPPDPTSSESSLEHAVEIPTQGQPEITPKTRGSQATIQRKMSTSTLSETVSSPFTGPAVGSVTHDPARSVAPGPGLDKFIGEVSVPFETMEPINPVASLEVKSEPDVIGSNFDHETPEPSPPVYPPQVELSSNSLEMPGTGNEMLISFTESGPRDTPAPDRRTTHDAQRRPGPAVVVTRSIRPTGEAASARLEPGAYAFSDRFEPMPVEAHASSSPAAGSPRIVIGRINVEVVPPPAQQVPPAPRTAPMTAASASVIGPLSSGVRPNVRLSLRYR